MSGEDPSFVGDHQRPLLSTSSPSSPTSPVSSLEPSRSPSAVTRSLSGGGSSNQYLGTGSGSAAHGTFSGRSRLGARRLNSGNSGGNHNGGGGGGMSEKARGKQPASSANKLTLPEEQRETSGGHTIDMDPAEEEEEPGRPVVIRFSGYPSVSAAGRPADGDDANGAGAGAGPVAEEDSGKDLDVWIDHGESVGRVKDKIRTLRPVLSQHNLRLIHSGRLLTDGILLLSWLKALEARHHHQQHRAIGAEAGGGAGPEDKTTRSGGGENKVYLHCVVGLRVEEDPQQGAKGGTAKTADSEEVTEDTTTTTTPGTRRRGFDSLLEAGLSPSEVASMRQQFYASRGMDVPEDLGEDDEHARALEEQWIEGDLTHDTATVTESGEFQSTLRGLLVGFLFPIWPFFLYRELPHPTWFEPLESETRSQLTVGDSGEDREGLFQLRGRAGGDFVTGVSFGPRMQAAILVGTIINIVMGGLRFLG